MRILTWNINGIRATNKSMSMKNFLDSLKADIICLQETKITRNLLTEDLVNVDGYYAFFSFSRKKGGYSGVATFCKKNVCPCFAEEGLTGIMNKKEDGAVIGHYNIPFGYDEDTLKSIDSEGRVVITEHEISDGRRVCIINVYCPRADIENKERYTYKMNFNRCLEARCKALVKAGKHVILVGDMNVSHKRIDHCDPYPDFELNEVRIWFNNLLVGNHSSTSSTLDFKQIDKKSKQIDKKYQGVQLKNERNIDDHPSLENEVNSEENDDDPKLEGESNLEKDNDASGLEDEINPEKNNDDSELEDEINPEKNGFKKGVVVDMFRVFHLNEKSAFTCWNTQIRARETNYGTRIDYILVSKDLASTEFLDCRIRPDVQGSDHCPVESDMKCTFVQSETIPSLCAMNMPEVCGKQQGIKSYFTQRDASRTKTDTLISSQDVQSQKSTKRKCVNGKGNLLGYFSKTPLSTKKIKTNHIASTDTLNHSKSTNDMVGKHKILSSEALCIKSDNDRNKEKGAWKHLLKGPGLAPLCTGHQERSVLRTVKKDGPNNGRQFYVCSRPAGHSSNKAAECGFFLWKT